MAIRGGRHINEQVRIISLLSNGIERLTLPQLPPQKPTILTTSMLVGVAATLVVSFLSSSALVVLSPT